MGSSKLLVAAGGTGGHIYPAIAVAEALRTHYPDIHCSFLCGEREIERRLYADAGIDPIVLPARQIGGGVAGKVSAGWAAMANAARTLKLIRQGGYKAVLGMGGYVTGPAMLAGVLARVPTVIHEANTVPGKTNRWIAPWVTLCATHFQETASMLRSRRVERVGMPIREGVTHGSRDEGVQHFGLDPQLKTILIQGGSQGAKHLYAVILDALPLIDKGADESFQILWATGRANYDQLAAAVGKVDLTNVQLRLVPFIERTDLALAVADAAISRGGASTMAELISSGIYAVYVPLPTAIYDHQTLNAQAASRAGAGEVLRESESDRDSIAAAVASLLARTAPGERMAVPVELDSASAAKRLADRIADFILLSNK